MYFMTTKKTKNDIESEVRALGVQEGDVLFLAADLLRVGYFSIDRDTTLKDWLDILLKIVGDSGTLVIPAYSESFPFFSKKSKIIFSKEAPTTSGSLSQAFQMYPGVLRSKHPTNSCFAIGRNAKYIIDGHDDSSTSYLPYQKVIELGGKNLMIGTIEDVNLAPMAMHCAQESLGLTKQNWLAGILQSYYYDEFGSLRLFTRKDVGGCSGGGNKAIGIHINKKAITIGKVGRALSANIDCKKSFEIYKGLLKINPKSVKCDNIYYCACCYGSPVYRHPFFWIRKVIFKINNLWIKKIT
jgi:aminoglycoside 3-N-acetyltransferase